MRRLLSVTTAMIAVVTALAGVGLSAGTAPKAGTVLGGGYAPADLKTPGLTLIAMHVSDPRHAVVWLTPLVSGCSNGPVVFPVALAADGSFSGTYRYKYDAKLDAYDGNGGGPVEYRGRFVSPDEASGTLEFRWGEGANDCSTGKVSFQVAARSTTLSGAAAANALYTGATSQSSASAPVRLPALVKVSADGKTATAFAYINVMCKKDPTLNVQSGVFYAGPGMKIAANGSFKETSTFPDTSGSMSIAYTSVFTGTFASTSVTGTWRIDAVVKRKGTGQVVDRCTSGPLTWYAER